MASRFNRHGARPGDVNVQVNLPEPKPDRSAWLKTILPVLVAGGIGVLGAVIGARTSGDAQVKVELARERQTAIDRRFDKAEEIVTLIAKTPVTYIDMKAQLALTPTHLVVPSDAERVIALVAMYFPDANELARNYEAACAEDDVYFSGVVKRAIVEAKERQESTAAGPHLLPSPKIGIAGFPNDEELYQKMLATGDLVTEKVLSDVGVSYKRRVPVTQPSAVRP
jgi:hypothetical protein